MHQITRNEYPLCLMGIDIGMKVPLCLLDGATDLPYMELEEWKNLLVLLNTAGGGKPGYELGLETDGPIATFTRESGYTMVIDFEKNTFRFHDYNGFHQLPEMSTLLDFTTKNCFTKDGEPSLMKKTEGFSYDRYGRELLVPLGDYDIELVRQDGMYLAPLQTLNDFMMAPVGTGFNCYFNTQCLYLTNTGIPDGDPMYYALPKGKRSEALTKYGYNELCLMLDHLYGLKEAHEIESFDMLFRQIGMKDALLDPDAELADRLIYNLISRYIDDIHSSFGSYSWLTGNIDYKADKGPSIARWVDHLHTYQGVRSSQYPDGVPTYEEVGNTAFLTIDNFAVAEEYEAYYGHENKQDIPLDDTVAAIIKAHEKITRENSPIENVVIDLSCNMGGDVDAAAFLLAWCLGKAEISLKDNLTGAVSNTEYWADVTLDRKFEESDGLAGKKLYCLISPVTFSCGNLVANVFRQCGKVTLLGRTSGGGSCTVQPVSSAWGTSFKISATRRMSFLKNGSLYDIDRGADPDYTISTPEKYYDRKALCTFINSLY